MKILGLPGKNQATCTWLQTVLAGLSQDLMIQEYDCWHSQDAELDLALESSKAQQANPDIVVAKSIGTLVALSAFTEKPVKAIFLGVPLGVYSDSEIAALRTFASEREILFIQQEADPAGPSKQLISLLDDVVVQTVPGDDHNYEDVELIRNSIKQWNKGVA